MGCFIEIDSVKRLGSGGVEEVKAFSWFKDVEWDNLNLQNPAFIPHPNEVTDTEYFDDRGAKEQNFEEEEEDKDDIALEDVRNRKMPEIVTLDGVSLPREPKLNKKKDPDFGGFMYRNLPLLEKANQKLVQKLLSDFTGADKIKSRSLLQLRQRGSSDFSYFRCPPFKSISRFAGSDSELGESSMKRRSRQISAPLRSRFATEDSRKAGHPPLSNVSWSKSTFSQNVSPKLKGMKSGSLDILVAVFLKEIILGFNPCLSTRFSN